MTINAADVLSVLDVACDKYRLPMMDNGYIFLAATRLSLFRSDAAWALVIERFGYSPRAEAPDTEIFAAGSGICNRKQPTDFRPGWYDKYLRDSPSLEQRSAFPIDDRDWQDSDDPDLVSLSADTLSLRGKPLSLPDLDEYARRGIVLERSPRVQTFELCRYLADIERDLVLATPEERRFNVDPTLTRFSSWKNGIIPISPRVSVQTDRTPFVHLPTSSSQATHPHTRPRMGPTRTGATGTAGDYSSRGRSRWRLATEPELVRLTAES